MLQIYLIFLVLIVKNVVSVEDERLLFEQTNTLIADINLPIQHLSAYFNSLPDLIHQINETAGPYRDFLSSEKYDKNSCWGYESNCKKFSHVHRCPGNYSGYVSTKEAQLDVFYTQADFGYIKQQIREMTIMCEPTFVTDSSLECSQYVRFCRGRNLMINFTDLIDRQEPMRYAMDVLKQGQIGGHCKLHNERLGAQLEHVSALQSWAPELRFFATSKRPVQDDICDVLIEKPTYLMKIDASVNMYHHFCDFFNLYASQHLNFTHPSAFSTDVHILIWESYPYASPFSETFKVFTANPLWDLNTFKGKVVCFKNLVMPLLPRMIFGLYYNTPIINGCENSELFHAFSEHVLHRLQIPLEPVKERSNIRITFLSRGTKYRKILNENDLITRISAKEKYTVQRVNYGRNIKFRDQLKITRNTDIFVGMHGAGLTHLLFLPKWATLFELYNCEDVNCYRDLARLRGVNYITWEKNELLEVIEDEKYKSGEHAKFKNYSFDVDEFERLIAKAATSVQNHPDYVEFLNKSDNAQHDEL